MYCECHAVLSSRDKLRIVSKVKLEWFLPSNTMHRQGTQFLKGHFGSLLQRGDIYYKSRELATLSCLSHTLIQISLWACVGRGVGDTGLPAQKKGSAISTKGRLVSCPDSIWLTSLNIPKRGLHKTKHTIHNCAPVDFSVESSQLCNELRVRAVHPRVHNINGELWAHAGRTTDQAIRQVSAVLLHQ